MVSAWTGAPVLAQAESESANAPQSTATTTTMAETPLSATSKVTVERRGQIVLIGINRPTIQNRVDPETYLGLAKAYYQYEHDPSLRAAVLFGHGENFSRGIDVDAFQALTASGRSPPVRPRNYRSLGEDERPVEAAHRGRPWRHVEYGARASPCRRHTHCRCRHALRSGREHAWPLPWWRLYSPVRPRSGLGERDALHVDRRPLER